MAESLNIYDELRNLDSSELINLERKNIFSYPETYFDDLTVNILRNIWFQSFSNAMLYSVPNGYFENFPQLMLDKLSLQVNYLFPANKLYELPNNYFNNLAGNILQKIATAKAGNAHTELEAISPFLSKIPKSNVYTVPEGYFEKEISIQHKKPATVISIATKSRGWFKYAAAACIAAIISLSGYFYIAYKSSGSLQSQIAKINVDKAISQLPDSALGNYLANDNSDIYVNQNSDEQDLDIQNLIKNTSDQDIEDFLNQNPGEEEPKGI